MKTSTRLAVAARAARLRKPSLPGALLKGLIAGAAGALAQNLFFQATAHRMPEPTQVPPDQGGKPADEAHETNLETVARRFVEGLMRRGPLDEQQKRTAAQLVHYAYGAGWGGVFALVREAIPFVPPPAFGAAVWMVSDNAILPAFRLAAWPQRYSLAEHRYALQAHLVYGFAVAAVYAVLREVGVVPLTAIPALLALRARALFHKTPPGRVLERRRSAPMRWFVQRTDRAFAH